MKQFQNYVDVNNNPVAGLYQVSDNIYGYALTANTAQDVTVPAGAKVVVMSCTGNYYFTPYSGALVPPVTVTSGYQIVTYSPVIAGGDATGLANDATVYTASIVVDGVANPISIVGSAAQTVTTLIAQINADLTGATAALVAGSIKVTSSSTGSTSSISITDTDLFSSTTSFSAIATAVRGNFVSELNPGMRVLSPSTSTISVIAPANAVMTLSFFS